MPFSPAGENGISFAHGENGISFAHGVIIFFNHWVKVKTWVKISAWVKIGG